MITIDITKKVAVTVYKTHNTTLENAAKIGEKLNVVDYINFGMMLYIFVDGNTQEQDGLILVDDYEAQEIIEAKKTHMIYEYPELDQKLTLIY